MKKFATTALVSAVFLCSGAGWKGNSKAEKPVFMVSYCLEVTNPYESLEMAVWKSGRVIWRVGEAGPSYGTSSWKEGMYFEGTVPAQSVRAALEQFRERKLLGKLDWATGAWPTPSPRRIEITDG